MSIYNLEDEVESVENPPIENTDIQDVRTCSSGKGDSKDFVEKDN